MVHRSGIDEVVVVQDEDERVGDGGGDIVEHHGENRLGRGGGCGDWSAPTTPLPTVGAMVCSAAMRYVRKRAGSFPSRPATTMRLDGHPCQPLADQGGFTKAGRGRNEGQFASADPCSAARTGGSG